MRRSRLSNISSDQVEPGSVGRRSFLRKASLGGVGALALAGFADVLAAPAANASSTKARALRQNAHLTFIEKGRAIPKICTGESTCYPCSGCCGAPCTPKGIGYCFYCAGTCGQGVFCIDHPPQKFSNCCH